MTSELQIEANRKNAKRSTGPKTCRGKAKSSRNAIRHGLARPNIWSEAAPRDVVAALVSGAEYPLSPGEAENVARVKIVLSYIRDLRCSALENLLDDPAFNRLRALERLERYERAARAKQKRLLRALESR